MFTIRIILLTLAFFALAASSQPLHGHQRRSHRKLRRESPCKPKGSAAATSLVAVSSTDADYNAVPTSVEFTSEAPEAEPTTFVAAASTKPSSASSAAPSATESASSGSNSDGSLLSRLFPVSSSGKSWSTADGADNSKSLSDNTFKLTNLLSGLSHNYEEKAGKSAMNAHFPQGSYTFKHEPQGGLSFYAPGPSDVDLSTAKEATFGYSVYFQEGFQFNKGGKLPGLFGGDSYEGGVGCSGGSRNDGCFSARLMWRTDGAGEMYTYLPPSFSENDNVCDVAPKSDCNPTYGASVARGSFYFAAGEWTTISERVKLNDMNGNEPVANGELELFANGKSVLSVGGLILRSTADVKMQGIQMQTFFGGSTAEWASPQDQDLWFADFSVAITKSL